MHASSSVTRQYLPYLSAHRSIRDLREFCDSSTRKSSFCIFCTFFMTFQYSEIHLLHFFAVFSRRGAVHLVRHPIPHFCFARNTHCAHNFYFGAAKRPLVLMSCSPWEKFHLPILLVLYLEFARFVHLLRHSIQQRSATPSTLGARSARGRARSAPPLPGARSAPPVMIFRASSPGRCPERKCQLLVERIPVWAMTDKYCPASVLIW